MGEAPFTGARRCRLTQVSFAWRGGRLNGGPAAAGSKGETAIFAQRPEKVKARIGDNSGPPRPSRHDRSVVRKVYFQHSASTWPHLVRVSPGIRADTVARIIMRIVCNGAGFLHSTVIAQDEGQEAHPLGAFYLFGALGKNSQDWNDALRANSGQERKKGQQHERHGGLEWERDRDTRVDQRR